MSKRLQLPLKYHGGKNYLAKKIVALMPPHTHYVEPYAGGLAVMLAKSPHGYSEVANDLDKHLTNFWRVLQSERLFEMFKRKIDVMPFSGPEWELAKGLEVVGFNPSMEEVPEEGQVMRAIAFFIRCRQSLAGRGEYFAVLSRNRIRRGMNEQASAWITAVDGLPEVSERMRRVVVLCRPALDVIREQDGEHTLFYIDCPYVHSTRTTTDEYGLLEMSDADHSELLALLSTLQGHWMLSGYESERYAEHFANVPHDLHSFELPNNAAGGKSKEAHAGDAMVQATSVKKKRKKRAPKQRLVYNTKPGSGYWWITQSLNGKVIQIAWGCRICRRVEHVLYANPRELERVTQKCSACGGQEGGCRACKKTGLEWKVKDRMESCRVCQPEPASEPEPSQLFGEP